MSGIEEHIKELEEKLDATKANLLICHESRKKAREKARLELDVYEAEVARQGVIIDRLEDQVRILRDALETCKTNFIALDPDDTSMSVLVIDEAIKRAEEEGRK